VKLKPAVADCWSVNITADGIGLLARREPGDPELRQGDEVDVSFGLPDADPVQASCEVMWTHESVRTRAHMLALGVRFRQLPAHAHSALAGYLLEYRFHVGAVRATAAQARDIAAALGSAVRLHFADEEHEIQALLARGDIAAVIACGTAAQAAALVEEVWRDGWSVDGSRGALPSTLISDLRDLKPRIIHCTAAPAAEMLTFFNARRIFRHVDAAFSPAELAGAVEDACAEYGNITEHRRMVASLKQALRREQASRSIDHVRVGYLAVERGYIGPAEFMQSLMAVGRYGEAPSYEDVWVKSGHLSATHLDDLLRAMSAPPQRSTPTNRLSDLTFFESTPEPDDSPEVAALAPDTWPKHTQLWAGGAPPSLVPDVPPAPVRAPEPSTERYRRIENLAEGGMGIVAECLDGRLGRLVALKSLQPYLLEKETSIAMLEREARVTGSLEHPSIIPVYDAGKTADGAPFYVMRLLKEPTLANVLERLRAGDARVTADYSPGRLLRCFIQVCQAVEYAHSRGVIHCDLKPANILLGGFGEVMVVDWGLAFVVEEGTMYRGGTLGYMAPEQLEMAATVDARADVYALGAILYEILCHEAAFSRETFAEARGRDLLAKLMCPPVPPRQRAPGRSIPTELEEICVRAMAIDRQARLPSARAMSTAIEAFLEGTRERERRAARAAELVACGDQLAEGYFELCESRPESTAELEALQERIAPWESPERKRELWDGEDRLAVTDTFAIRTAQAAISNYEQALDEVPGHPEARRALARIYLAELRRAKERGDEFNRVHFEELVKQHDDGALLRVAHEGGWLSVACNAPDPTISLSLSRIEERNRRLVPISTNVLGAAPLQRLAIPQGVHVLAVELRGRPVARYPLVVSGGSHLRVSFDIGALGDQQPGEVLVPGGTALLGSEGSSSEQRRLRKVDVAPFFIDERPVTFHDYLAFVARVYRRQPEAAARLLPRHGQGAPFWEWDGGRFVPGRIGQWGADLDELLAMPVFGVDFRCAETYARWRARLSGRPYRLPRESEWEKAGRGADRRTYPWGNHFDASFCRMRESRPGLPRPEPSGTFVDDVSPYGVRDLAGGLADWVLPDRVEANQGELRQIVSRGGAWCDWAADCALSSRRSYWVIERSARVGFRLARDAPAAFRCDDY
jgi:serine/threonine protein kinase/formylglycine-generating enzyme required for sulfatase activity